MSFFFLSVYIIIAVIFPSCLVFNPIVPVAVPLPACLSLSSPIFLLSLYPSTRIVFAVAIEPVSPPTFFSYIVVTSLKIARS